MTQLTELDAAVIALNELWQLCTDDDQCDQLLDKRDALDDQAQQLANRIIREGTNEFHAAISALNDLTRAARSAKKEVDDIAKRITKTATAISKATTAVSKVAVLLA